MSDQPIHILFSGGVTGGHLFPGLAVAEQIKAQYPSARITFAGAGRPLDRQQVFQAGYDYLGVPCHATPRRLRDIGRFLSDNHKGIQKAIGFIKESHVSAVIGLGGYASAPTARAAARCDIPLVLLEQNFYPGRANRWLSRSADMILTAFSETRRNLRARCPIHPVGNPVRGHFLQRIASKSEASSKKRLLILGGSNGAGELNLQVPKALYRCRAELADWEVTHQSGTNHQDETQQLYEKLDLPVQVIPFLEDMASVLTRCDLAISRAGGTTLSELAVSRVPVILCPLPGATDDHQTHNANHFAARGAAIVAKTSGSQDRLDNTVADCLQPLLTDEARRQSLSTAIGTLARPDAATRAATLILNMLRPTAVIPPPMGLSTHRATESRT